MGQIFRGLVAGLIAGVAMNIWNLTDYKLFNITNLRFWTGLQY